MYKILLFTIFLPFFLFSNDTAIFKDFNIKNENTFYLSYMRGGTNWLAYCITELTKIKVLNDNRFKQEISAKKPRIFFAHSIGLLKSSTNTSLEKINKPRNKLVVLVRNYKESFLRNGFTNPKTNNIIKAEVQVYLNNIILYDEWNPKNRLLIYYEDLISDPRSQLLRIASFFKVPTAEVNKFMKNIQSHKTICMSFYDTHRGGSKSRGNDILFHSKQHRQEDLQLWDMHVKNTNPYIYKKYLERFTTKG